MGGRLVTHPPPPDPPLHSLLFSDNFGIIVCANTNPKTQEMQPQTNPIFKFSRKNASGSQATQCAFNPFNKFKRTFIFTLVSKLVRSRRNTNVI